MNKSDLSADAKIVWNLLNPIQQRDIHRNNPIRGDRNKVIRDLKNRKVKVNILVEISGLSKAQIIRITNRDRKIPLSKLSLVKHKLSETMNMIDKVIQGIDEV